MTFLSLLLDLTVSFALIFILVVFMGSSKYPDENGFDAFLKKHGGSDNASTDCERTVFQFDVQRKYFKEALDRYLDYSKSIHEYIMWGEYNSSYFSCCCNFQCFSITK